MNTFTKTLIASAMAVAVAGPAAADVKSDGAFRGTKTTLKVKPSGCPNATVKNITTDLGFYPEAPSAGCWAVDLEDYLGSTEDAHLEGGYIERKFGKDLTGSLFSGSLFGLLSAMEGYLEDEAKCDTVDADIDDAFIKKGNVKLSKNGDQAKLDFQIDGKYTNDSGKTKNIKATIKGKTEFVAAATKPPAFDCDEVPVQLPE